MTYTLEAVERLLPAAFGGTVTTGSADKRAPKYMSRCRHCQPGRDSCVHRCDLDQWDEGCMQTFEDDEVAICRHVHNGRRAGRCGICWCFSPHGRRASVNVKWGNTVVAAIADMRRAWAVTPLLAMHRRRLFLRYGLDWTQAEIAGHEGVSQQAVAKTVRAGLGALVEHLNGS